MNIILFVHPAFLESQSMPRYASMLSEGMKAKGHEVEIWSPKPLFYRLPIKKQWLKWMGYIDQYIIFPHQVKKRLKYYKPGTIYVFSDQALGPWVPLVANYPHIIHCHDFLAQRSALGEVPENKSKWSGKKYQSYIRQGFRKGKNFISVSENTKAALHRFLGLPVGISEVVYNGLNQSFQPGDPDEAHSALGNHLNIDLSRGYILHVGGNQWYKNRKGVIEIYEAWRKSGGTGLPLLMVGKAPDKQLLKTWEDLAFKSDIHWISNLSDQQLQMAYHGAAAFLFPSLAEGFGWPIAEAMASGCPVILTGEAPMTEVAAQAGFNITRRPAEPESAKAWADAAAKVLNKVITLSSEERKKVVEAGIENAKRFDPALAMSKIEALYQDVLQSHQIQ